MPCCRPSWAITRARPIATEKQPRLTKRGPGRPGSQTLTQLERAIELAMGFKQSFVPFTYKDVGLAKAAKLQAKFKAWCVENDVDMAIESLPGRRGWNTLLFYPFYMENRRKVLASPPHRPDPLPIRGASAPAGRAPLLEAVEEPADSPRLVARIGGDMAG